MQATVRACLKAMKWLLATSWGLAVLFLGLWAERSGVLGPSFLNPWDRPEHPWIAAVAQHPEMVVLRTSSGIEVIPLPELVQELDDARVVGRVNLAGSWSPSAMDPTIVIRWRHTRVTVSPAADMTSAEAARAATEFVALQRTWGNGRFVRGLQRQTDWEWTASGLVIRWDIALAHARATLIPAMFLVALGINIGRALACLIHAFSRDVAAERLARGLCPACLYDIAVPPTSICPECGLNLDRARREAAARGATR